MHHLIKCIKGRGSALFTRHQHVLHALQHVAKRAGVECSVIGLKRWDIARDKREADLQLVGTSVNIVLDVVVSHPIRAAVLSNSKAVNPKDENGNVKPFSFAWAADQQAKRKDVRYKAVYERNGVTFLPFALETYGATHSGVSKVIKALCTHAEHANGESPRAFGVWAWNTLSVALQAANSLALTAVKDRCSSASAYRVRGRAFDAAG